MKVYILGHDEWEGTGILGIYSSKAKAVAAFDDFQDEGMTEEDNVFEFDLDPLPEGGRFELYYYAVASTKGAVFFGKSKLLPSEVAQECKWMTGDSSRGFSFQAYGKTELEAEALAKAGLATLDPVWQVRVALGPNPDGVLIEVLHPHPSMVYKWDKPFSVHKDLNVARQMEKIRVSQEAK